jgi:hypothetical protein
LSENESNPSKKESGSVSLSKDAFYGILIIGLAALLVISVMTQGFGMMKPAVAPGVNQTPSGEQKLPDAELKSKLESYINANLLSSEYKAQVTKLEPFDSHTTLASLNIMQGTEVLQAAQAYISNDGSSIFLGQAFKTNETKTAPSGGQASQGGAEPAKTDKPKAEAFVMAFCPYGLQFLKAYVPVMELLGDKADLEVRFVDYAMHGASEVEGNSYIYCVQKEGKAKLTDYLRCFVKEGDYTGCVATAGVDEAKVASCVSQLDAQYNITGLYNDQSTWAGGRYPPYPVDADLNEQYGVQGSPTFVLNGVEVSVGRNAEAVKQAICASFTEKPAECNTTLRTEEEAPGLGEMGTGTSVAGSASCG